MPLTEVTSTRRTSLQWAPPATRVFSAHTQLQSERERDLLEVTQQMEDKSWVILIPSPVSYISGTLYLSLWLLGKQSGGVGLGAGKFFSKSSQDWPFWNQPGVLRIPSTGIKRKRSHLPNLKAQVSNPPPSVHRINYLWIWKQYKLNTVYQPESFKLLRNMRLSTFSFEYLRSQRCKVQLHAKNAIGTTSFTLKIWDLDRDWDHLPSLPAAFQHSPLHLVTSVSFNSKNQWSPCS